MSAVLSFAKLVQWQVLRVPATGIPTSPVIPSPEEIQIPLERLKRLDQDPVNPDPPKRKKEPTPIPTDQTQPQPEAEEEKTPWKVDPKTCQISRPTSKANDELMTQAVIAGNAAQAMTEAYNRGYKAGRAASKNWKTVCGIARKDADWLNKRLKRIILSQDNGPRRTKKVSSRNGGNALDQFLDAAS